MPEYLPAKADVLAFIHRVAENSHGDLTEHGVTFSALMVHPNEGDESGEPVLKLHGYPVAATCKPTTYKQRVKGAADVEMEIDWLTWKDLPEDEREALLDHEIRHAELARDEDGNVKIDRAMRPVIKTCLHDVQVGWFMDVARRHGEASFEVKQARQIQEKYGQLLFSWAEGPPPLAKAADNPPGVPQDAPSGASSWHDVTLGDLGLAEATVSLLDAHTISTVGELVAIARHGLKWMGDEAAVDVEDALSRFRNRRSNADIEEFDAARDGEAPLVPPRVRGRRAASAKAETPT